MSPVIESFHPVRNTLHWNKPAIFQVPNLAKRSDPNAPVDRPETANLGYLAVEFSGLACDLGGRGTVICPRSHRFSPSGVPSQTLPSLADRTDRNRCLQTLVRVIVTTISRKRSSPRSVTPKYCLHSP